MAKYIPLDALVAEINKRITDAPINNIGHQRVWAYNDVKDIIDTLEVKEMGVDLGDPKGDKSAKYIIDTKNLEVKEVDLEKEIQDHIKECLDIKFPTTDIELIKKDVAYTAKKFFELGLNASNPVAEGNLEALVRQVNDLSLEACKYYNNIMDEERGRNGGSDLAICLYRGTIDAQELCIQYVLDKLKAQKGE